MAHILRIKICGLTRAQDASQAAALGADAIGLNFYPRTPRFVDSAAARAVLQAVPPLVEPVGVFTEVPQLEAATTARELGLRVVQWHGDAPEPPGPIEPCRLVPAFPVRDEAGLDTVKAYLDRCREVGRLPAAVLLDGSAPGLYGGTGVPAPWRLLADFRPELPVILAGGLRPDNVAEAVRIVRPYAVDVASGVEAAPGIKDEEKMRRFIGHAREAAARLD